jgi:trk system potassium uptake protein TrkH
VRSPEAGLRALDRLMGALGVVSLAALVLVHGFPEVAVPRALVLAWSAVLPIALFLDGLYRLLWVRDPWLHLRRHPARYVILLAILLELSGLATWRESRPGEGGSLSLVAAEVFLALSLLGFAASWAKGAVLANAWLASRRVPVLALPAVTFLLAIGLGAALLALPGLHLRPAPLLDHLFTATSAVCVTGLCAYDVSQTLDPLGRAMLAGLVQLGGLGTLTVLGWLTLWRRGRLSLGERAAFSDLVGGDSRRETKALLRTVIQVTLLAELLGALLLGLLWRGRVEHALPVAAFHSISAFCNAGFSLFPDSFASFRDDPLTLLVVMALIAAGGAGFPVVLDAAGALASRLAPWTAARPLRPASRATLSAIAVLVPLGAVAFLLDGALQGRPRTALEATFQSVTARTAGFQVEGQRSFAAVGLAATVALMAIGASAQSTGGGIKTNVVIRLFRRGERDGGDPSPAAVLSRPWMIALVLVLIYAATGTAAGFALARLSRCAPADALFEAFSALGTVGLSRDLTPALPPAGKGILIALMFTGRVLYPTLVVAMTRRRPADPERLPWA